MDNSEKTCIVLEGGAMRGLYTAGVLDVFMENNVSFDVGVGVSAGAAFGCNLKSKQIGRVIRYNKRFAKDKRYCSVESWLKTGNMYNAEFCYHTVPESLDVFDKEMFDSNPMEFYAVCTDANTGEAVYQKLEKADYQTLEYIRASCAIPVASRPVKINRHEYFDGGVSDSIPVEWALEQGYKKIVVVLTQPYDYVKEPQNNMTVYGRFLRNYPMIDWKMRTRHIRYNQTVGKIKELEQEGRIVVIRPNTALNIGSSSHDAKEMERVYQIGRTMGNGALNDVRKYLAE